MIPFYFYVRKRTFKTRDQKMLFRVGFKKLLYIYLPIIKNKKNEKINFNYCNGLFSPGGL